MTAPNLTNTLDHLLQLPVEVVDNIKQAVEQVLDPEQPDPTFAFTAGDTIKGDIAKALDKAIEDLDFVLKWFAFLIPDSFEVPLRALESALRKVRSLLD